MIECCHGGSSRFGLSIVSRCRKLLWMTIAIASSTISAQSAPSVWLSGGAARAFDATGPIGGLSVVPWSITNQSAISVRAGLDGWLSYTNVASSSDMHRTMWGIGPVAEVQFPRDASPTAIYTRFTAQVVRSSIPDVVRTDDKPVPLPDQRGVARSGLGYGGEVGLVMGHPGGRRFRLGVGYLRHAVYDGFADGMPRVMLSVEL